MPLLPYFSSPSFTVQNHNAGGLHHVRISAVGRPREPNVTVDWPSAETWIAIFNPAEGSMGERAGFAALHRPHLHLKDLQPTVQIVVTGPGKWLDVNV